MQRQTCIIVDDHAVVRAGTRLYLDQLDWLDVVGEASSGYEGLEQLRQLQPDLVMLDMQLPDLDGVDIVAAMVAEQMPTRAIIFSGQGTGRLAEQALAAGAHGFVLKGAGLVMLGEALHAVAEGRRFVDPTLAADMMNPRTRRLSDREHEILQLMSTGKQNGTIAHDLEISIDTVKAHVSAILCKLEVGSRTEAVAAGLRTSIIV